MNRKELQQLKSWTQRVTRGQKEAAVFMDIWNDQMADNPSLEPAPVMQLGYAMLLDKPIVVIAPHGSRIPENVKRVARAVEFFDKGDTESLHAATLRAFKAAGNRADALTYQLVKTDKGYLGIKCLICGLVSYNLNDIRQRYCGHCHRFHDDPVSESTRA